jgi:predicted P-loop ATPase
VVTGFVEVLTLNDNDNVNDNCLPDGKVNVSVNVNVREGWRQFTDDDRNSLWRALSRELGVRVVRQDISAVVKSDFSPRYHPFEEYIGSLQPWDGETDHIDRLASMVTVCGDQNYFRRVFKKWLVAFIAAIFDPEEVNHEILVFIGRQGCYKSTWFHYLLPPELRQYFLPKLMSNSGITKDDLFKIAQSGLVCLEEIDNMKQRDLNQLKALTTMRTINERRSYGEFNELHRHIASFCATGNNRFFLTDHTGNRRFLTFEIESIVPPQTYEYNYEGVYAQAYALWRQGYRYWFNDEENDEINQCNTEFESPNKERELIMKYYRRPLPGVQCRFLTATDMLERINGGIKEQLSTVRIGMVMRELGIERIRSGNLRGYRLIENTQADIEVKQKSMGSFTEL